MKIIVHWAIAAIAVLVSAYVLPGVKVDGVMAALATAVILGLINAFLKPILIVLTLPINVVTLGLFTLVINAALVLLTSAIVPGFHVAGFWWAVLFSVVLYLVSTALQNAVREKR